MMPVWPIADNICFDCKVNGGWPRPLLTYYEVHKILHSSFIHEISNNVVCATSKASDQPAHTRSLIRVFASRLNTPYECSATD